MSETEIWHCPLGEAKDQELVSAAARAKSGANKVRNRISRNALGNGNNLENMLMSGDAFAALRA